MIDVVSYVRREEESLKERIDRDGTPSLCIVTDKLNRVDNQSYIRSKVKSAERLGIHCEIVEVNDYPFHNAEDFEMQEYVRANFDGVIVQYPFYNHSFEYFQEKIVPQFATLDTDVDGLLKGSPFVPCTPFGIIKLMDEFAPNAKFVTVIGYGGLVGKPLIDIFNKIGQPCAFVRSNTPEETKKKLIEASDVVICCTNKANMIKPEDIHPNTLYIDAGCDRIDGKLCGNIDKSCYNDNVKITPVPKGVGLVTVLSLMINVHKAKELS